jgi:hypothetical protein
MIRSHPTDYRSELPADAWVPTRNLGTPSVLAHRVVDPGHTATNQLIKLIRHVTTRLLLLLSGQSHLGHKILQVWQRATILHHA